MFCDMLPDKKERIMKYYEAEDWSGYAIELHSLKSTSLSIGGQVISSLAEKLEKAGKANDAGFIKENHALAMELYEATVKEGYKILSGKAASKK